MNDGLYQHKYRVASARWAGHDYSLGGDYFITICTKERRPYFGRVVPAPAALKNAYLVGNALSSRAYECWLQIPQHFPFVETGAFTVMPDHVHGVLHLQATAAHGKPAAFGPQAANLAAVVRGFKVGLKSWATMQGVDFAWQPRYFDRVIRNAHELEKINRYIIDNPNRWETDRCHDSGLFC